MAILITVFIRQNPYWKLGEIFIKVIITYNFKEIGRQMSVLGCPHVQTDRIVAILVSVHRTNPFKIDKSNAYNMKYERTRVIRS